MTTPNESKTPRTDAFFHAGYPRTQVETMAAMCQLERELVEANARITELETPVGQMNAGVLAIKRLKAELNEIKADLSIAREANDLFVTRVKNPLIAENNQLHEVVEGLVHNIQLMTMLIGKDAVIKILTKWNKLNSNLQRCK